MSVLGAERRAVQRPFIRYATEAGWTYLAPEDALDLRRGGVASPVLDAVLVERLQRLNPGVVGVNRAEDLARRIARVRPTIEGNRDVWEFLKGLRTVFVPDEKRERNICLVDPDDPSRNVFHVTDELTFSRGTPPDIWTDIAFFINGVPVLVVETKAAHKTEGIAAALDDIRYYHEKAPEFMALPQLHALTHLVKFYYGGTWNLSRKGIFNWRDEAAPGADFESLCKTFVAPRRMLKILSDFILFVRKDDELIKAVLRPHQMRASDKCVGRAADPTRRRGLIWHTQGSGKTYTIITVAKQLLEDERFENPTVLMLIDRTELESQLSGELEAAGFKGAVIADSKDHLRRLLAEDRRGLIVSMIHKFHEVPEEVNTRANVFVLVDEAHRTTGGDLGNYLMGALPNATYIGFTGTPIDRTAHGKGTFKVFGADDEKGYLDKYSISESVEDGTTVALHYILAENDMLVDRETLEREFLGLQELEGVSDIEEINAVLERAVTLRNMLKNEEHVSKVAARVAEHFRENVEPMGYKAFLVAVDREACGLYKAELDKHLPPDCSRVVVSGGGKGDPFRKTLEPHFLTTEQEKQVRKDFRRPDKQPKILIVTEKLLTGYDAPILYCMYLDKPMRDHVLLQAIARVNRPHEDAEGRRKPCGLVYDFVGIFDKLEKALAFDSQDVSGVVEGIDILKERFEALMERGRSEYLAIWKGFAGDKAVEAVLEHFRDEERRDEFYKFFRETQDTYEILSPDAFLRPFVDDYNALGHMYQIVRGSYERGVSVDREFLRKTAALVREHTSSSEIAEADAIQELTPDTLAKIASSQRSDTVKVFNLLKAIQQYIDQHGQHAPYLIDIGERAESVAEAYEQRQETTRATLESLQRLIAELRKAEDERTATDLSPESFAVYWLLRREGLPTAKEVAEAAAAAFAAHPHWQVSARQEQEVRKSLYKALIDGGAEKVVEIGQTLMRMLRRGS